MFDFTLLNLIIYILINLLPGIGFFLIFGDFPHKSIILVAAAWVVSTVWNLLWSLFLLYFGLFSWFYLIAIAFLPFLAGFIKQKANLRSLLSVFKADIRFSSDSMTCVLVALVFSILIITSPRWNFLISPNMDAGNYETYSNHFWKSGNLYWDLTEYLDRGVPWKWIQSKNTWVLDQEKKVAMPVYLYGFPVMLGQAKTIFNAATLSWIVNFFFGVLSAALLTYIALNITKNRYISIGISILTVFTPMFFYYSKQIMSEMSALFGFLTLAIGLFEYAKNRSFCYFLMTCAGCILLLQVKLDAFIIPVFVALGLAMGSIATSETRAEVRKIKNVIIAVGLSTFISAAIVCLIENTYYLEHLTLNFPKVPGQPFLFSYAIYVFIGLSLIPVGINVYNTIFGKAHLFKISGVSLVICFVALLWIMFVGYNLGLRSIGKTVEESHDAFNLYRTFSVGSPVLLLLLCVCYPLSLLKAEGIWAVILYALGAGFIYTIYNSNHSPPDIWWMRRYLIYLPVLTVLVASYTCLIVKEILGENDARTLACIFFVGAVIVQIFQIEPMIKHKINQNAPIALADLEKTIPDKALIIVLESSSTIRGAINTFRSLRSGPTLLNVPNKDLKSSIGLYKGSDDECYLISNTENLNHDKTISSEFMKKIEISRQWVNTLELLHKSPSHKNRSSCFIYKCQLSSN